MKQAHILAIATSNPAYKVEQTEVREFAKIVFRDNPEFLERLLPVFTNSQIQSRYFSQPIGWFDTDHDFSEANAVFIKTAADLCVEAATDAINSAGVQPSDIGAVVYVTSTGIATPSIDSHIILRLGLPQNCKRIPIWGLGCAGGVSGLARAAEIANCISPDKCVLFVAVELCSLTFQRKDISKSNIIAASLFGDGAAAIVLSATQKGSVRVCNSSSRLYPNTEDIMGWDVVSSGLKVRFSRDIPSFIENNIPAAFADACTDCDISPENIQHYVLHPGGVKVLDAYCSALHIQPEQLRHSRFVLQHYGNMSSCSVLFVLKQFILNKEREELYGYGTMLALGPGFSSEALLLDFGGS